jgi:hypothetical protein
MRKSTKAAYGIAALAVVGVSLFAAVPANAASNAPVAQAPVTGAPGARIDVRSFIYNYAGTAATGTATFTLKAPSHSTFESNQVWQTNVIGSVTQPSSFIVANGCSVNAAKTQMTCSAANMTIPAASGGYYSGAFLSAPVIIDATAAPDTTYSDGQLTLAGTGTITSGSAPLAIKTTAKPTAPTVTNVDNTGGVTKLSGVAAPNSVVTVKDASGKVIGTVTAGSDGKYTVSLDKNYANGGGDLTVTTTKDGYTSDSTAVKIADAPIVDPAIAGGAGIAALAALGAAVVIRRKRAAQI